MDQPGVGTGPRTGSDPTNNAQETAVLRSELRGLEALLLERATYLEKALALQTEVHDRRLEKSTQDTERRIEERWSTHQREHRMIEAAVGKAEQSVDKRLEAMNELREQITAERSVYLTRAVYDTAHTELRTRVQANSENLIKLSSELSSLREDLGSLRSGQEWLVRLVAGAVITAVIGILFALIRGIPN